MARITLLLTGCIFTIYGCGLDSSGVMSEQEMAVVADAVEQRVVGYCDAVERSDVDWLLKFWADIDEFVIGSDGELATGYENAIAKPTRDWFAGLTEVLHCEMRNGHAYVLARDAASYTTEFDWGVISTAGDTVKSRGSWTYVFKKLNGEWKVVHSAGTHLYY